MRRIVWFLVLCVLLPSSRGMAMPLAIPFTQSPALFQGSIHLELVGTLGRHGVSLLSEGVPTFTLDIHQTTGSRTMSVEHSIYDDRGNRVLADKLKVSVKPGANRVDIDLAGLQPGWYRMVYAVTDEAVGERQVGGGSRDFIVLSGRESNASLHSPFGVKDAFGIRNERLQAYEANILQHIGAGWVLGAAAPTWAETQFQPGGHFVWRSRADEQRLASEANLIPLATIGQLPDWLAEADTRRDPYLTDYYQFVRAYREAVPNVSYVSTLPPLDTAAPADALFDYAKQLKVTTAALQNPNELKTRHVVQLDGTDLGSMEQLLSAGIHLRADALLVHLPEASGPPEQYDWASLKQAQIAWNSRGGGASLWTVAPNASIYLPSGESVSDSNAVPSGLRLFGTPTQGETEEYTGAFDSPTQAQWLVRSHLLQLSVGVDRIFAGPLSTGPSGTRLFSGGAGAYPDIPQRPRPALAAYATMTEQLAGATYLGQLSMPRDIWAFVFAKHGRPILAVWTTRDRALLELNNVQAASVTVVGPMGTEHTRFTQNQRLILELDPAPQYVHGLDVGTIAQVLIEDFVGQVADLLHVYRPRNEELFPAITAALHKMATELWLHALTSDSPDVAASAWNDAVVHLFNLGAELVEAAGDGEAAAQAALYELYDLLPVLAEAGTAIGIHAGEFGIEDNINGTLALLMEAADALHDALGPDGSLGPHAHRMLATLMGWRDHIEGATPNATAAWAIVAREAAALAALRSQNEVRLAHAQFLMVGLEPVLRPYPGFQPAQASLAMQPLWENLSNITQGLFPDLPGLLHEQVGKGSSKQGERADVGVSGWDEIPLAVQVVNASRDPIEATIQLRAPDGWLWRIGDRILPSAPKLSDLALAINGASGGAAVSPIDLSVLIPTAAKPGEYTATVGLHGPYGYADEVIVKIVVQAEQPQSVAALSGRDAPLEGEEAVHP